jgi:hypothetical protein
MIIKNGYIIAIEQDDEKYTDLIDMIREKPQDPDGYQHKLRADNLEWELVELPPEPEPSEEDIPDEEALNIILGGGAE